MGVLNRTAASSEFVAKYPHLAAIYAAVTLTEQPNHKQALQLLSTLKLAAWSDYLRDYTDNTLIKHLQYGFPLGFVTSVRPTTNSCNHTSKLQDTAAVDNYLHAELCHKAIAGPVITTI